MNIANIFVNKNNDETNIDIYSRLLTQRIIFLKDELSEEIANAIVAQMLFLDAEDSERDITFLINNFGGSTMAAMTVYDAMNQIRSDICTVCMGTAAEIGAFLLTCGTKGKRYALPNARIILRQPSGKAEGRASDIEVVAREILSLKELINKILAENTGRSQQQIDRDTQHDFIMSAEEAINYGLIDKIVTKAPTSS